MVTGFKISGVDIYDMKTLSGVKVLSDWEVVKEFDFTKATDHTFADGVAQPFGGVNWTAQNIVASAGTGGSIEFIEGTGLQMHVTGAGSPSPIQNLYHTHVTFPLLGASVSDIYPAFDEKDTLCFQALLTSSLNGTYAAGDAQNPGWRLAVTNGESGPATSATWYSVGAYQSGYAPPLFMGWITRTGGGTTAGAGNPADTANTGDILLPTYLELVAEPGAVYIGGGVTTGSSGKDITSFPRPLSTSQFRSYGTMQELQPSYIFQNPGGSRGSTQHYQGSGHGIPTTIHAAGPPQWGLRPSNMTIAMMGGVTVDPYDVAPLNRTTFEMGNTTTWTKLRVLRRTRND